MTRRLFWVGVGSVLVALASCGDGGGGGPSLDDGLDGSVPEGSAGAIIGPEGGTVTSGDGAVTVTIPAGALASPVPITIVATTDAPPSAIGTVYEIGPTGTTFAVPVTLELRYETDDTSVAESAMPARFTEGDAWEALLGSVNDPVARVARGFTTHLSRYGVARADESPSTCAFDRGAYASCCSRANGSVTFLDERRGTCVGDRRTTPYVLLDCYENETGTETSPCSRCARDCCSEVEGFLLSDGRACGCMVSGQEVDRTVARSKRVSECLQSCYERGLLPDGPACDVAPGPADAGADTGADAGTDAGADAATCGPGTSCECVAGTYRNANGTHFTIEQNGCTITVHGFPGPIGGPGHLSRNVVQGAGHCNLTLTSDVACWDFTFNGDQLAYSYKTHLFFCQTQEHCDPEGADGESLGVCNGHTCVDTINGTATKLGSCSNDGQCGGYESCEGGQCVPCGYVCNADGITCSPTDLGPRACQLYGNGCGRCVPS